MWIISLKRLRHFWAIHPRAELPVRSWFTQVTAADWTNFEELRATFRSADLVGNCIVFNISGNHYQLITRLFYASHKVYVLRVMTHQEYDQVNWAEQCGCYMPPPKTRHRSPRRRSSR